MSQHLVEVRISPARKRIIKVVIDLAAAQLRAFPESADRRIAFSFAMPKDAKKLIESDVDLSDPRNLPGHVWLSHAGVRRRDSKDRLLPIPVNLHLVQYGKDQFWITGDGKAVFELYSGAA